MKQLHVFRLAESGVVVHESERLGELFDRSEGSVGFALTQPLKARVDLKLLNRLRQAPKGREEEVSVGSLRVLVQGLLSTLPQVPQRWFWFCNPGRASAEQEGELRVEEISLAHAQLEAGFDHCLAATFDTSEMVEVDLRSETLFESDEGPIEIRSESGLDRYGPALEELLRQLAPRNETSLVSVRLAQVRTPLVQKASRSFEKSRMPARPPALKAAVEKWVREELVAQGFEHQPSATGSTWRRADSQRTLWVTFQPSRVGYRFRVHLKVEDAGRGPGDPPRSAELQGTGTSRLGFSFSRADELEASLRAAVSLLASVGQQWLCSPDAWDFDGWHRRGLVFSGAKRGSSAPLPLP